MLKKSKQGYNKGKSNQIGRIYLTYVKSKLEISLKVKSLVLKSLVHWLELPEGKSGLVHISEVADNYVENVAYLSVGDEVDVKVLSIADDGKNQSFN